MALCSSLCEDVVQADRDSESRVISGDDTVLVSPGDGLEAHRLPGQIGPPEREEVLQLAAEEAIEEGQDANPEQAVGSPSSAQEGPAAGQLVLGRYRVLEGSLLGEGGWCRVLRAEDTQDDQLEPSGKRRRVALKTFHAQAMRQSGEAALGDRFAREIATFERLGLSRQHLAASGASPSRFVKSKSGGTDCTPGDLVVNLLDFSRQSPLTPSTTSDGRYYSVLELADEPLDAFLDRRCSARDFVALAEVRDLARSLAAGLALLHRQGLCHCDVKPANIMRFGERWKLIDLEGALALPAASLSLSCFTPLYAAPEVAQAVLADTAVVAGTAATLESFAPSAKLDVWAAGVVLLDVLAHECAFQETWSGYQAQHMMDFDAVDDGGLGFLKDWYEWLADPSPIRPSDFASVASSRALLDSSQELRELLFGLLAKDPNARLSTEEFLQHPFLALDVAATNEASPPVVDAAVAVAGEAASPEGAGAALQQEVPLEGIGAMQAPPAKASLAKKCCAVLSGRSRKGSAA